MFGLQPGLQKWQGNKDCSTASNKADCIASSGQPNQNAGLQSMVERTLITAYDVHVAGGCEHEIADLDGNPYGTPESEAANEMNLLLGGTGYAGERWMADVWLAGGALNTYRSLFNLDAACAGLDVTSSVCVQLVELNGMTSYDINWLAKRLASPGSLADKLAIALSVPRIKATFEHMWSLTNAATEEQKVAAIMPAVNQVKPTFSSELRGQACAAKNAILFVNSTVLQGQPGGGDCDHWIFLESCDPAKDEANVWSWGYRHTVSYSGLVDKHWICGAVIAD